MKESDIMYLRPGVSQLEEGCCEWNPNEAHRLLISYGKIHIEPEPRTFCGKDHSALSSGPEDVKLEQVRVNDIGKYVNKTGEEHELPDIVFEAVVELRVGQKIMIVDAEASNVYVIKLQDIEWWDNGKLQSLLQSCEMADEIGAPPELNRQRAQRDKVDGPHQVKDVDQVINVNVTQKSSDFAESMSGKPTLSRQDAMTGLEAMSAN